MSAYLAALTTWLIAHGGWGMFISAFLAGSILPFSSEVVMAALILGGASPVSVFICGTVGNTLGTLVNYGIGRLGREEWITKYAKVSPEKLERGKKSVSRYGSWAGLLSWLPVFGEILTVAMGFLRTNFPFSLFTITLGKAARYYVVIFLSQAF